MTYNYILCGVGGQGTVLASKIIAYSAMKKGKNVRTSETIGMAQRGGSVVSYVRTGDEIHSPQLPLRGADVMIGFEPGEAVKNFCSLKSDGIIIVNKNGIIPVTASLDGEYNPDDMLKYLNEMSGNVTIIDGDEICEKVASHNVLNIVLLAAAAKTGKIELTMDDLKDAVKNLIPEKFHEINFKAIEAVENL